MAISTPYKSDTVGSVSGTTFTATTGIFASGDVGRLIVLTGGNGELQHRKIVSYTSASVVEVDHAWDTTPWLDTVQDVEPAVGDSFVVSYIETDSAFTGQPDVTKSGEQVRIYRLTVEFGAYVHITNMQVDLRSSNVEIGSGAGLIFGWYQYIAGEDAQVKDSCHIVDDATGTNGNQFGKGATADTGKDFGMLDIYGGIIMINHGGGGNFWRLYHDDNPDTCQARIINVQCFGNPGLGCRIDGYRSIFIVESVGAFNNAGLCNPRTAVSRVSITAINGRQAGYVWLDVEKGGPAGRLIFPRLNGLQKVIRCDTSGHSSSTNVMEVVAKKSELDQIPVFVEASGTPSGSHTFRYGNLLKPNYVDDSNSTLTELIKTVLIDKTGAVVDIEDVASGTRSERFIRHTDVITASGELTLDGVNSTQYAPYSLNGFAFGKQVNSTKISAEDYYGATITLLDDPFLTETDKAVIDTYTELETPQKLYDYAYKWLFDNYDGRLSKSSESITPSGVTGRASTLVSRSGETIDAGSLDVEIDSAMTYFRSGTVGTAGTTRLEDVDESTFRENDIGRSIRITSGAGAGQVREITDVDYFVAPDAGLDDSEPWFFDSEAIITEPWDTVPEPGDTYEVVSSENWIFQLDLLDQGDTGMGEPTRFGTVGSDSREIYLSALATPVLWPSSGPFVASVVSIFKSAGQEVSMGEPLLEVETDDGVYQVKCDEDGVLGEWLIAEGDEVSVNQRLGTLYTATASEFYDERSFDPRSDEEGMFVFFTSGDNKGQVRTIDRFVDMEALGEKIVLSSPLNFRAKSGDTYKVIPTTRSGRVVHPKFFPCYMRWGTVGSEGTQHFYDVDPHVPFLGEAGSYIHITSGANKGQVRIIDYFLTEPEGNRIVLDSPLATPVAVGDSYSVISPVRFGTVGSGGTQHFYDVDPHAPLGEGGMYIHFTSGANKGQVLLIDHLLTEPDGNRIVLDSPLATPVAVGDTYNIISSEFAAIMTRSGTLKIGTSSFVGNIITTGTVSLLNGASVAGYYTDRNGTTSNTTLTLSGLQANSEVRVYEAGTINEITGVENSTTSFSAGIAVNSVDIVIFNESYKPIRTTGVDTTTNVNLPIQQIFDRNYTNP